MLRLPFKSFLTIVPPPSSDRRKWWLENNASSKAEIEKPPGEGWVLNPNRPTNPFVPTTEPDWIKVITTENPLPATQDKKAPPTEKKAPPLPPPRRQQSDRIPSSPRQVVRQSSSVSLDSRQKPPVPPKPSVLSARASISSSPPRSMDGRETKTKPPLPLPLRGHGEGGLKVDNNNNASSLMDDDESGGRVVDGWIPLQPSKEL